MPSGAITSTGGRCGNPRCHCHRPGGSAHGLFDRLTRSSPGALAKARREVAGYRRFRELGGQPLEVDEAICRSRLVEEAQTPRKRQETAREADRLLRVVFLQAGARAAV
jgi:hypothetical protein